MIKKIKNKVIIQVIRHYYYGNNVIFNIEIKLNKFSSKMTK